MAISIRKAILLTLNLLSTVLTLLTGLRENPVIVAVSGRYDHIRARMIEGTINYDSMRQDLLFKSQLTDLMEVGKSFRFISAPDRSPANLAEDRSTCMRVNSMNATRMSKNFDDFWGYGPRRAQIFVYSISTPQCSVVNFQQKWFDSQCVAIIGAGNERTCHKYILDNFTALADDRVIQVGVEKDFGIPGVPMLKCLGRPEREFEYFTDLMVQQSFWSGGSYHVEVQSSRCLAQPLIRNDDWKWGLFKVVPADHAAKVVFAVDSSGWVATIISVAYGLVSIIMIIHGVLAAILRVRAVRYLPAGARFLKEWRFLKYVFPFMNAATVVTDNKNRIITFKGAAFMASDVWMNHWLYISLSILDAVASIRTTYVIFEMGTWMLTKQANFENFIFLCSALTRITWIMCFVHSLLRFGCKLALRSVKSLKWIRPALRDQLEWYVDASSLFMSYKTYSILLCFVLFMFLKIHGSTTLMRPQPFFQRGVFGGDPDLAQFWGNEIICDMFVMVMVVLATGVTLSSLGLLTKYRYVTRNGFVRLLQERFVLVGWDAFICLEALGIDPFNPELIENGVCRTNCSLGAIIQQLYTSGLSGHVNLAGDFLFLEGGFSKEALKLRYPVKRAVAMGLCESHRGSAVSNKYTATETEGQAKRDVVSSMTTMHDTKSLFDRKLKIVTDGCFGQILFVDEDDPGRYCKSTTSTSMEFEVNEALSMLTILDIKPMLGNEKKLRIR